MYLEYAAIYPNSLLAPYFVHAVTMPGKRGATDLFTLLSGIRDATLKAQKGELVWLAARSVVEDRKVEATSEPIKFGSKKRKRDAVP